MVEKFSFLIFCHTCNGIFFFGFHCKISLQIGQKLYINSLISGYLLEHPGFPVFHSFILCWSSLIPHSHYFINHVKHAFSNIISLFQRITQA